MDWPRILAYITGTVDQTLLLRKEYLAAENRILKAQIKGRLRLSDPEKKTLAEIGHRLGRKAFEDVANAAVPDTILGWYRTLVARKFDGSKARRSRGRPPLDPEIEQLIIRMATDNLDWGYDRIVGALANLGHNVSDQTVGNVLRRHGIPPAPERKRTTTWAAFIRTHLAVLAGTDFFSVEVFTLRGLVTFYVLSFIHLESRKVELAGVTTHPYNAASQLVVSSTHCKPPTALLQHTMVKKCELPENQLIAARPIVLNAPRLSDTHSSYNCVHSCFRNEGVTYAYGQRQPRLGL